MKKNKLIYIVRHGETEFNKLGIVQGSGVDTDLNETGRLQAKQFFDNYQNIDFDKIYISALKRTKQSIQSFVDRDIPYEILPELNEISWGEFEGKVQDFKERTFYQQAVNEWNSGNYDIAVAQGETPNQLQARQRIAVQKILTATDEKTVLVCMHGRALKSMVCLLLNEPLSKMDEFQHTNLGLYLFGYDGEKFELIKRNDIEHLH
jgi:probable phosphoglycerate mutase